jgi:hypothetical protein
MKEECFCSLFDTFDQMYIKVVKKNKGVASDFFKFMSLF